MTDKITIDRAVVERTLKALQGGFGSTKAWHIEIEASCVALRTALEHPVLAQQPAQQEQEVACYKHGDEPEQGCSWCAKQPAVPPGYKQLLVEVASLLGPLVEDGQPIQIKDARGVLERVRAARLSAAPEAPVQVREPVGFVSDVVPRGGYVEQPDGSSVWTDTAYWSASVCLREPVPDNTKIYTHPATAVQQEPVEKKLIGWRTENYLWETNDIEQAKNWEPNIGVLPIFEGDTNTLLNTPKPAQVTGMAQTAPIGYVRMLNGEPTPDDNNCVFSYGSNPYRDTYDDEEWVPAYTHPAPAEVREALTREQVKGLRESAGYDMATPQENADFINGIRHAEAAHGITGSKKCTAEIEKLTESYLEELDNLSNRIYALRIENANLNMYSEKIVRELVEALKTCTPMDYSTGHVIHPSYDEQAVEAALIHTQQFLE